MSTHILTDLDYYDFEKLLGSKKEWISFERKFDKRSYDLCTFLFLSGLFCVVMSNVFDNPISASFFLIHCILFIIYALLIKKISIPNGPSNAGIVDFLDSEGLLDEFIFYLERKITPYGICQFLDQPFYSNWSFNILFSGFFTIFTILFTYFRNDLTGNNAQILSSIIAIIFYFYLYLSIKLKRFFFESETAVTLCALKELKKIKDPKSDINKHILMIIEKITSRFSGRTKGARR